MEPLPTAANPLFRHRPLMPDGSTFRLVQMFPGSYDDCIHCKFLEVPVSTELNYHALSYTWGSPETTAFVQCCGSDIAIGYNLEKAIRRIRSPEYPRSYWIDALCIDQRDDAGEKTTQIPLMRRIYQQASKVSIYLGEEQDGSESIPALCESFRRAYDTVPESCKENSVKMNSFADWESLPRVKIIGNSYDNLGFPTHHSEKWGIFTPFFSRPWFSRIWVIQEAILSTSAEIICGSWTMKWSDFIQAIVASKVLGINIIPSEKLFEGSGLDNYKTPIKSLTQVIYMETLGAGRPGFARRRCIDLMYHARSSLTTMPHDYCYGILGIAEELGNPDLKTDYALPVEEVYCQFARFFVHSGDGVKVLYNAGGRRLKLPSWVPDWSYRFIRQPQIAPTTKDEQKEWYPSAATSHASSIELHPELRDVLVVRGIVVDRIQKIGLPYGSFLVSKSSKKHPLPTYQPSSVDLFSESAIRIVADCIVELTCFVGDKLSSVYASTEHEETIIWKNLTCGYSNRFVQKEGVYPVNMYRQLLLLIIFFLPGRKLPHMLDTNLKSLILSYNPEEAATIGLWFLSIIHDQCYDKLRGRTTRGYVGQFSDSTQIGDIVFLPLGSAVPFTIRPKDDGTYELLGDCYVHGIMDGEAFSPKGIVEEDILLS